jgi:hypothetical protein
VLLIEITGKRFETLKHNFGGVECVNIGNFIVPARYSFELKSCYRLMRLKLIQLTLFSGYLLFF